MAQKPIFPRRVALQRTLDGLNRRLSDAQIDDPAGTGQQAQALRAQRAAIKAKQQQPA